MTAEESVQRLERAVTNQRPEQLPLLNPGLSKRQIAELETALGLPLPEAVSALYRWRNGSRSDNFIDDKIWLPLERAVAWVQQARAAEWHLYQPTWLPLFDSQGAGLLAVDLESGEVIDYFHEEGGTVISSALERYLTAFCRLIEHGEWTPSSDDVDPDAVDEAALEVAMERFGLLGDLEPEQERLFDAPGGAIAALRAQAPATLIFDCITNAELARLFQAPWPSVSSLCLDLGLCERSETVFEPLLSGQAMPALRDLHIEGLVPSSVVDALSSSALLKGLTSLYLPCLSAADVDPAAFAHLTLFDRAELFEEDDDRLGNIGLTCARLGHGQRALALFREMTERSPGRERAWRLLGDQHRELGQSEAALAAVERAIELVPSADNFIRAGVDLQALGRIEDAVARFGEAVEADPGQTNPRHWRTHLLCQLGRQSEAQQSALEALAYFAGQTLSASSHYELGAMAAETGLVDAALQQLQLAFAGDASLADRARGDADLARLADSPALAALLSSY